MSSEDDASSEALAAAPAPYDRQDTMRSVQCVLAVRQIARRREAASFREGSADKVVEEARNLGDQLFVVVAMQ